MDAATALIQIYRNAYMRLLESIAQKELACKSTRYQRALIGDVRSTLGQLDKTTEAWVKTQIPKMYKYGVDAAALPWTMNDLVPPPLPQGFAQVHQAAVEAIAQNMANQLKDATAFVGRRIEDQVRTATLEATAQKFATGETLRDMKADLVNTFVDEGLTAIKDGSGRQWRLDTYAEMVTRTTTAEAANTGTMMQLKGFGHDLVQMTEHRSPCEICAMYEGRVYSIEGKTPGYPRLDQVPGFADGYNNIHPNCIHAVAAYIPNFDKDAEARRARSNAPFEDKRSDADKAAYERSQQQNTLRRDRKRLEEKVAVLPKDSDEYKAAREKLRETRSQQQSLGREQRAWKEQSAKENRAYYAARDAGQDVKMPGLR
ncbi:MAG: phage minor capsid protein [Clostridia bacterium]|nr:phage minor capsid protein [Clostridia bacterium]